MQNVMTFKTSRNESTSATGTALVRVEDMSPREAFLMHTSVKERGRGAVKKFIDHETPYNGYGQYHYQLLKLGVMPMKKRGAKAVVSQDNSVVSALESKIKQLEMQLSLAQVTPANRALDVLNAGFGELHYRSRGFLCSIITKDSASLSPKQEKWLSDLETQYL